MSAKLRLDQLLVERGFFPDLAKARPAIMAGRVRLGESVADKPGLMLERDASVSVEAPPKYVGRGGFKLEHALKEFGVVATNCVCLDIGASTGGFTDCLLQQGAAKVWAIDVGHGQMDWKIRNHPKVVVREKLNARHITHADIPDPIDVCVADVSFISLTLILPPALQLVRSGGVLLVLIKPQFELPREAIGAGGIVRDPALHQQAVDGVRQFVEARSDVQWVGVTESPILGNEGNKEFLACLRVK